VQELSVEHEDVRLHVEVEGPADAVPVVLLHGVTTSSRTWAWLPEELTRGRRTVRIDFRGHGRSGHAPGTYDLAHYASDVVAVLDELAAAPAVVVGHSLGGVVAWRLAQSRPELLRAALLEDPPLFFSDLTTPEGEQFRAVFEQVRANAAGYQAAGLSEEDVAARIGAAVWGPPGGPTFRELAFDDAVDAMGFGHSRMDVGVLDSVIDGSALAAVDLESPVGVPTTVIGADDAFGALFRSAHAARLAQTHPEVEVVRIEGCGHGIHDERRFRDTFCEHLARFLDRHAPVAQTG
jgi:pimeloyl-ACP methyl ester carboxylesterase